jgi:xanthine dehydrogenase YagS FAD-binding subunit
VRPFRYRTAASVAEALELGAGPETAFLAGGTELVNWLKDGIAEPDTVVDIGRLPLTGIEVAQHEIRIGALARLSEVARHPVVSRELPALTQAIESAASPQIRAMGTLGGNLLQRNRCPYFRSEEPVPCNRRAPGSGCSARSGDQRAAAVIGIADWCIATHPSDPAVALTALGAHAVVRGPAGERAVPIPDLYSLDESAPTKEIALSPGALVTEIRIPRSAGTSRYLKVRDRAAFTFALVSAAARVEVRAGRIQSIGLALGGVAYEPWRLGRVEAALIGALAEEAAVREAMKPALDEATPLPGNRFKVGLAIEAATRVTLEAMAAAR